MLIAKIRNFTTGFRCSDFVCSESLETTRLYFFVNFIQDMSSFFVSVDNKNSFNVIVGFLL